MVLFTRTVAAASFAIVAAIAWPANAEDGWTKVKTERYTLNNKQDAIAFADAKNGWYGNGTGRVYRTTDGGATWKTISTKRGTYVRALEFADDKIGFLGNVGPGYFPNVSDANSLYVTRDSGAKWTAASAVNGPKVKGICAIDVLKRDDKVVAIRAGGRVGGPATMMESFDEGRNWRSRDMSDVTGMILDIKFLDENIGFIAGASESDESRAHARILKTTDGGKSWRAVFESALAGENNWKLAFPTASVGYATIISYQAPDNEARGYVAKTDDGGEHWQKMKVTDDKDWVPFGINFIDETRGWVGGSTGGYETQDGGLSWQKVQMGLSVNKIRFVKRADGGTTAFAIGQDLYRLDLPGQ